MFFKESTVVASQKLNFSFNKLKTACFFCLMAILFSNAAMAQKSNQGYIYNVKLDLDHRLNCTGSKDFEGHFGVDYHNIFSGAEVNTLLASMSTILQSSASIDTVLHLGAQKYPPAKKGFGSLGKSVLNEGVLDTKETYRTLEFFPVVGLKKALKTKSSVYYDIDIKVKYGGDASDMIVMDKVKKKSFFQYKVDYVIEAKGQNKKVIWKKKGSFNDFSEMLDGSIHKEYFRIEGRQSISSNEIEKSVLIALNQLID